jgi:hypothetical protein
LDYWHLKLLNQGQFFPLDRMPYKNTTCSTLYAIIKDSLEYEENEEIVYNYLTLVHREKAIDLAVFERMEAFRSTYVSQI